MRIQPTTSGLDLPLLCRLSYEVGQRKSAGDDLGGKSRRKQSKGTYEWVRVHYEINGRSNSEVVGSIPTEAKRLFLYLVWFPDSLN